jgi:hypothetical protein
MHQVFQRCWRYGLNHPASLLRSEVTYFHRDFAVLKLRLMGRSQWRDFRGGTRKSRRFSARVVTMERFRSPLRNRCGNRAEFKFRWCSHNGAISLRFRSAFRCGFAKNFLEKSQRKAEWWYLMQVWNFISRKLMNRSGWNLQDKFI